MIKPDGFQIDGYEFWNIGLGNEQFENDESTIQAIYIVELFQWCILL